MKSYSYTATKDYFLSWAKSRFLDYIRCFYNPTDDFFMKQFKETWDKDEECKNIKLELNSDNFIPKNSVVLTGKEKDPPPPESFEPLKPYAPLGWGIVKEKSTTGDKND